MLSTCMRRMSVFALLGAVTLLAFHNTAALGAWESLGPANSNVSAIAAAPSNPSCIIIQKQGGTPYSSENGGHLWTERKISGCGDVSAFLFSPDSESIVLALEAGG